MTEIYWSKPLEAVHDDGRVFPARQRTATGYEHSIMWCDGEPISWEFFDNGTPWPGLNDWRIRNTPQQTPTPDVVGDSFLVPKLTEAQAREWVATNAPGAKADGLLAFLAEHSALLPEPVDGERKRAEEALTEVWYAEDRFSAVVDFAVKQVARGRALERGGA